MSKFFATTKKGELHDLREDLASSHENKKVDAVKRVIRAMTEGKDVSELFTDVLNCMQTRNLELKKLVYLYVMNYAKSQPDRAILAVNTFHKDATDQNPLVRALAIRTMSCIRVAQITEYLTQPLQLALKDTDAYVRKTAAIAVAKLYDINPEAVDAQGFLTSLRELLADGNPMVVSNAVAALSEIASVSGNPEIFTIDSLVLDKILAALNEATEWGQVYLLDALARYEPASPKEAENICERVSVRLNHSNSAVVLSAVKVVLLCLPVIRKSNPDLGMSMTKKLGPPLVTLLSGSKEPEIQYVALRNIRVILQREPNLLRSEVHIFFCKYNDPIYVKLEKLELMIALVDNRNSAIVLAELKEYASMVDVEFVRKSVRAIGRTAIKLPEAAEDCVKVLIELINTKVNYVVQEAIVVIRDIFRRYPNKYESVISTLCEALENLDEPDAKAAMIWIIGEYADRISNADELLDGFLDGFGDESPEVQLQLLTAVVKLFLKKPRDTQDMVTRLLSRATQESSNPDLRDRGFMYWRLLSADPEAAKAVVLGEKPLVKDNSSQLGQALLDVLVENIGTLASVFHKLPAAFSTHGAQKPMRSRGGHIGNELADDDEDGVEAEASQPQITGNILDLDLSAPAAAPAASGAPRSAGDDLLASLGITTTPMAAAAPVAAAAAPAGGNLLDDMFGGAPAQPAAAAAPAADIEKKPVLCTAEAGKGMEIRGLFVRQGTQLFFDMACVNRSQAPLSQFAMQFNKNPYGITPAGQPQFGTVAPGASAVSMVPLSTEGAVAPFSQNPQMLQIAIKNSTGQISYFTAQLPAELCFNRAALPQLDQSAFGSLWQTLQPQQGSNAEIQARRISSPSALATAIAGVGFSDIVLHQSRPGEEIFFAYVALPGGTNNNVCLVQLVLTPTRACRVQCRAQDPHFFPIVHKALDTVL